MSSLLIGIPCTFLFLFATFGLGLAVRKDGSTSIGHAALYALIGVVLLWSAGLLVEAQQIAAGLRP